MFQRDGIQVTTEAMWKLKELSSALLCRNSLLMGCHVAVGEVVHLNWMDSLHLHYICQALSKKEKKC